MFAEQTIAGPFTANQGAFLMACLYGLSGVRLSAEEPASWPQRPVVLPAGSEAICAEQPWTRGDPARFEATHGATPARLMPHERSGQREPP